MINQGWQERREITNRLNRAEGHKDYDYSAYLRAKTQYQADIVAWQNKYPDLAKEEAKDRNEMIASENRRYQQAIRDSFVGRNLD